MLETDESGDERDLRLSTGRRCPICQGDLIGKDPVRLVSTGALMILLGVGSIGFRTVTAFALPFFCAIGIYLLSWAIDGGSYWCRNCKRWPPRKKRDSLS